MNEELNCHYSTSSQSQLGYVFSAKELSCLAIAITISAILQTSSQL